MEILVLLAIAFFLLKGLGGALRLIASDPSDFLSRLFVSVIVSILGGAITSLLIGGDSGVPIIGAVIFGGITFLLGGDSGS